jgi:hypothetical protein
VEESMSTEGKELGENEYIDQIEGDEMHNEVK